MKAWIAKSCENCALLSYYTVKNGNSLLTFRDNLLVSASRVKKSKTENKAQWKLPDTIFF